jgi:cellulose synthase/poly-beta-1,6-N-acetylglucosamine synthase-like glycosyltransferase
VLNPAALTVEELVFWSSATLIMYAYFGYPLLMAFLARLRPTPVRCHPFTPSVTLLLIVHNEEQRLDAKIKNSLALEYPPDRLQMLVVTDGSTDRSGDITARQNDSRVRLLGLPGPRGKAASIADALPHVEGEVVVLCDVRQAIEVDALQRLVANLSDPAVGAVSGELLLGSDRDSSSAGGGLVKYWSYEKLIRQWESRFDSTVGVTGAFYAVRRGLLSAPDPRTILDDVAIPMEVVRRGHRVVFDTRARAWDEAPSSAPHEFRRKVRTLAGNYQLVQLMPWLLHPRRNPLWFQFVSHKLLRLAVPWCFVVIGVTSVILAAHGSTFFTLVALAQLGVYGLGSIGALLGRWRPLPTLLSLPAAFLLLNAAAAVALFSFLGGSQKAAWRATRPG